MSWKAVELQVALPRTQEISRIQEQQQQRHMHQQQQLIEDRKQVDQANRQRAAEVDAAERNQIRERQPKQPQQERKRKAKTDSRETELDASTVPAAPEMRDPLRGRHIDISL